MNPINFIPTIIATFALAYASFTKMKGWAMIAFVVWIVMFVLTFFIIK